MRVILVGTESNSIRPQILSVVLVEQPKFVDRKSERPANRRLIDGLSTYEVLCPDIERAFLWRKECRPIEINSRKG